MSRNPIQEARERRGEAAVQTTRVFDAFIAL